MSTEVEIAAPIDLRPENSKPVTDDDYGGLFEFEEDIGQEATRPKFVDDPPPVEDTAEDQEPPSTPGKGGETNSSVQSPLNDKQKTPSRKKLQASNDIEIRSSATKPQKSPRLLAHSLPVTIPARLRAANQSWNDYLSESDEEEEETETERDDKKFKKVPPHEIAARTYHEVYFKPGFQFDVPSSKHNIKSII